MSRKSIPVAGLILTLVAGCSWVQPLPTAAAVQLVEDPDVLRHCRLVGHANVQVLGRVLGLPRGRERVAGELATLARNTAPDLGGNRVLAVTPVEDGRQRFAIYRCD